MGMLEENMQQQNSVPGQGPPDPTSPQSPPPVVGGEGPGTDPQMPPEQEFKSMSDEAVKLVYDDRFELLLKMFKTNGPERFARSMAVAVNTVIAELEKKGPLAPEMAANVGGDIYLKLLEDIISYQVVPGVTLEQVGASRDAILDMYAQSHPDVSQEDIDAIKQAVNQGVQQGVQGVQDDQPDVQAGIASPVDQQSTAGAVPPGNTIGAAGTRGAPL